MQNRRSFLTQLSAAGLTAPFVTRGLMAASPNSVVRHASFGGAGMAAADLKGLSSHPKFKLVCAAEIDGARLEKFRKDFPDAKVYPDWREMLDKEHKLNRGASIKQFPISSSADSLRLVAPGPCPRA